MHVPHSGLFSRVMENVRDAQLDCLSLGSLRPLLAQMDYLIFCLLLLNKKKKMVIFLCSWKSQRGKNILVVLT